MENNNEEWYPATGFYFKVEIEGISDVNDNSFKEVSGFDKEMGFEEVVEGGVSYSKIKLPTQSISPNLVLKRGVLSSKSKLYEWVEQSINTDFSQPLQLKRVLVKLLNQDGLPMITWGFNDARPVKYSVSDLDSMRNEVLMETLEFTYSSFDQKYAN